MPIILKNKSTALFFIAGFLALVTGFSLAYVNILENTNLLVIHFDSFKGADFFGDRRDIVDILVTAAIIWIINFMLANEFYFRERILSYILAISTLLFSVLIFVAVNVIININ